MTPLQIILILTFIVTIVILIFYVLKKNVTSTVPINKPLPPPIPINKPLPPPIPINKPTSPLVPVNKPLPPPIPIVHETILNFLVSPSIRLPKSFKCICSFTSIIKEEALDMWIGKGFTPIQNGSTYQITINIVKSSLAQAVKQSSVFTFGSSLGRSPNTFAFGGSPGPIINPYFANMGVPFTPFKNTDLPKSTLIAADCVLPNDPTAMFISIATGSIIMNLSSSCGETDYAAQLCSFSTPKSTKSGGSSPLIPYKETCIGLLPPLFDTPPSSEIGLEDGTAGPLKRGWYDLSNLGVANDYCRYVNEPSAVNPWTWVCAMASNKFTLRTIVAESLDIFSSTKPNSTPGLLTSTLSKGCPVKPPIKPKVVPKYTGFMGWYDVFNQGAPNDYCFRSLSAPSSVGSQTASGGIPIYPFGVDPDYPNVKYFMMSPNNKAVLCIDEQAQQVLIKMADGTVTWSQDFKTTSPGPYFFMLFTSGSFMVVNAGVGISCITSCGGWPVAYKDNAPMWLILRDDGSLELSHNSQTLPIASGSQNPQFTSFPKQIWCILSSQKDDGASTTLYPGATRMDPEMSVFT
jgi:hypothetical protein